MSKLQHLIAQAKQGLSVMESISDAQWRALAIQCGAAERAEVRQRIQSLKAMSLEADEGDDEQRDDIRCAIDNLNLLLSLSEAHERTTGSPLGMHLAPNFPDDPTMRQLVQLLHEELGLPERKAISLNTAINFDLGCDGADAEQLMLALEERFVIEFVDYDAYRYFQPEGFDVFLKRRAKGRGDKLPLTIGMLYQAIKAQRWDTQEVEAEQRV